MDSLNDCEARAITCGTLKPSEALVIVINVERGKCPISPRKRAPRNAKSKRGRGVQNCPVEVGKDYEVDITETSPNGEGVARIKGFFIFVGNAKPGDHLRVKVTKIDAMSGEAEIAT